MIQKKLWTQRYESLREYFLENRHCLQCDPLELGLLIQKGVAGWMNAWKSTLRSDEPTSRLLDPFSLASWTCKDELTGLIAQIATRHL